MSKRKIQITAFAAAAALALGASIALHSAAPAQAGEFCYPGSSTTKTKTYSINGTSKGPQAKESLTYTPLFNCSRIEIGVEVTHVAVSYTGGYQSSTHGITEYGVDMFKSSYGAGQPAGKGSIIKLKKATRSASSSFKLYIYNGTYDGQKFSFSDVSTYGYYDRPDDKYAQDAAYNLWLRESSNGIYAIGEADGDNGGDVGGGGE